MSVSAVGADMTASIMGQPIRAVYSDVKKEYKANIENWRSIDKNIVKMKEEAILAYQAYSQLQSANPGVEKDKQDFNKKCNVWIYKTNELPIETILSAIDVLQSRATQDIETETKDLRNQKQPQVESTKSQLNDLQRYKADLSTLHARMSDRYRELTKELHHALTFTGRTSAIPALVWGYKLPALTDVDTEQAKADITARLAAKNAKRQEQVESGLNQEIGELKDDIARLRRNAAPRHFDTQVEGPIERRPVQSPKSREPEKKTP